MQQRINKKFKKDQPKKKIFDQFELLFAILSIGFIMPLIYLKSTFDPTLAPRLLFLSIVVFILFLFSFRYFFQKRQPIQISGTTIFILFFLYLLVSLISLFKAINPAEGIFDITKTFLTILLLFYLTIIFQRNGDFINVLANTIVLTGLISSAFGLYQYFIFAYGKSDAELFSALYNINGLMAHKNQYAIFLFLIMPFTIYGTFYSKNLWRILSSISLLLIFILILLIQTRSVWIGTVVFILVSFALVYKFLRKDLDVKNSKKINRIVLIASLLILSSAIIYITHSPNLSKIVKYKIISIYDLDSEHNRGRLEIAEATIEMIKDHPIMGVGAGNWKINYPVYYTEYQGIEYKNWRRPHNDFLWIISEKGIIGFVIYILMLILILYYGFKTLSAIIDKRILFLCILMIASIIGYIAISNFSFPYERIIHQSYLVIYIAILMTLNSNVHTKRKIKVNLYKFKIAYISLFIPLAFSLFFSYKLIMSDYYGLFLNNAYKMQNHKEAIFYSNKAFSRFTTIDQWSNPYHFYSGLAWFYLKKDQAEEADFLKANSYHPYHYSTLNNLANFYLENKEYRKAVKYYCKVLDIFPFFKDAQINLAQSYFLLGKYKEAYKILLQMKIATDEKSLNDLLNNLMNITVEKIDTAQKL